MGNTLGGFIRRAIAMFTLPQSNQAATFPDPVLDAGSHTPIGAASANGHSEATQSREAGGPLTFPGSGEIVTAAEAAKAAYKKHRRRAAEGAMSLSDLMDGFTIVREVDEYIFFQRGTDFYLAIPGTYRIMEDWVACNLQHDLQRPPELFANLPGDVAEWGMHRGFLRRLQEVLAKNNLQGLLEDWVEGWAPPQRLVISGHSLGGAVAAMLTLWLLQLPVMTPDLVSCLACITFGAPLLTTQAAGRRLEEERPMWTNRFTHIVAQRDPVPRLLLAPGGEIQALVNARLARTIFGILSRLDFGTLAAGVADVARHLTRLKGSFQPELDNLTQQLQTYAETSGSRPSGANSFPSRLYGTFGTFYVLTDMGLPLIVKEPSQSRKLLELTLFQVVKQRPSEQDSIRAISEHSMGHYSEECGWQMRFLPLPPEWIQVAATVFATSPGELFMLLSEANQERSLQQIMEYLRNLRPQRTGAQPIGLVRWQEFECRRKIGEGAHGAVYATTFRGKQAAVKVFRNFGGRSVERSFNRELDAMRALDHQNIVRLLGGSSSTDTGQFALLMDLYPEDMESALQAEEPVEWEEKLSWAVDIAAGMRYCHAFQTPLVHGDLKPSNVLLGPRKPGTNVRKAVICDLGSSKLQGELTTSSLVLPVSTPQYRAPEVWQGQKLTPLSDVFAFGVLLHQLITQRRPFAGFEPATLAAVITNEGELRNRLAIPADAVPGTIANGLQDLLERCLRQERGVRPSFGQIHEDLKRLQTSYKEGKEAEVLPPSAVEVALLQLSDPSLSTSVAHPVVRNIYVRYGCQDPDTIEFIIQELIRETQSQPELYRMLTTQAGAVFRNNLASRPTADQISIADVNRAFPPELGFLACISSLLEHRWTTFYHESSARASVIDGKVEAPHGHFINKWCIGVSRIQGSPAVVSITGTCSDDASTVLKTVDITRLESGEEIEYFGKSQADGFEHLTGRSGEWVDEFMGIGNPNGGSSWDVVSAPPPEEWAHHQRAGKVMKVTGYQVQKADWGIYRIRFRFSPF